MGNAHPNIVPYQSFCAKDGYLVVAVGNDGQFCRYAEALGVPELARDECFATNRARVENRDILVPVLQARMLERDKKEWLKILALAGVPAGPINSVAEVFVEPQIHARGMQVNVPHQLNADLQLVGSPIKLSRTPVEYHRAPPILGQHTDEVIKDL
jgi:crotonobetainyl-CoA:carnitine CoA-transferase CaiB-like acyl-CoA transferase